MLDDEGRVSRELAGVIGADRLNDVTGSDKLREFYKKLIQTDAQIKKLKQGFESNDVVSPEIDSNINVPERYKRSLKFVKPQHRTIRYNSRNNFNKRFADGIINGNKRKRVKKDDYLDLPDGYLIEKKKVLIQYKPFGNKRQFPKCSHTPKDSKYHEKQLKHPFYQNSQRLDELLDNILDRNIPELVKDPITLDLLFSKKAKCNHKPESKGENLNLFRNPPNAADSSSTEKELKSSEEISTEPHRINQYWQGYFKEETNSINPPKMNTYNIQNVTLFDHAIENKNYEMLQNSGKNEPKFDKNNYITDPSSNFMAKIHSESEERSSKSYVESKVNTVRVSDKITPLNYDFKSLYEHNLSHNIPSKIGLDKNEKEHKNNFNEKGLTKDSLIEMALEDATTEKTFDMNLDYGDILLRCTPKTHAIYTKSLINEEKEPDFNIHQYMNDWRGKSRSVRKLLQIEEEDDDTLGYEDLKEVLADEMEVHDETDRRVDRNRRSKNYPDVYNHNWKGPIPLYPDEINAIIKQAAIENVRIPVNTKDLMDIDRKSNQISDTDYIEDYFDDKYDRIVKIAQAYSDYGVLDEKKEGSNLNTNKPAAEKDVTTSRLEILNSFNNEDNARYKKGTPSQSEGIRFEIKPGKGLSIAKEADIIGSIKKHFKIMKHKSPKTTALPYVHPDFSSLPTLSTLHYSPDKTYNFNSKTVNEPILVPKRTLKSIENSEVDDVESDNAELIERDANNTLKYKNYNIVEHNNASKRNITSEPNTDVINNYKNNSNLNTTAKVSDFFAMMSEWFSTLAKLSGETSMQGKINSSAISTDNIKENKSFEVSYPSYDSDMIENIGHRSRVLMSVKDNNVSLIAVDLKSKGENKVDNKQHQLAEKSNHDAVSTTLETTKLIENTTIISNKDDQTQSLKEENLNIENKTISKRSIGSNSKLNFWNDMYDDEYGVKLDYSEKSERDKHSVNTDTSFVKKSKNWFQSKVKGFANKFHTTKSTKKGKVENISIITTVKKMTSTSKPKIRKRRIRSLLKQDAEDGTDFAALTANMKKVVREAANAVRETRKLTVREDNKEESMASSLMQQLVRLMADVVDFQVQQKTCAKLPADLQKFLEWLTSASDKDTPFDLTSLGQGANNGYSQYEKPSDVNVGLATPEDYLDDRTQCLRSIQSVQELIKQYEDMNDEDKSKMTGVKQYLENQLNFLNKKYSALDEYNIYKYYKKRETPYHDLKKKRNANFNRRRLKRRLNKFIKNFGKKHTKTTAGNIDAVTETKIIKKNR